MSSKITIAQEKALINAELSSTLMFQFLIGIYTGVFSVTIYIYGKGYRNRSYNKTIAAITVVLFLIAWTSMVSNWYLMNIAFCKQATTLVSMVLANLIGLPSALQIVTDIARLVGFILADSLLVWRCFHANGGRLSGLFFLPMMLLIVEILLVTTTIILDGLALGKPGFRNVRMDRITNQINGTTFGFIAATSVTSTAMICNNIYAHTQHNYLARKRVVYVVEILTQSCGIYTVVTVGQAILSFLNTGDINNFTALTIAMVNSYFTVLSYIALGLIPTLMVARLAATASYRADSANAEPTSLVSLPLELRDQLDAERACINTTGRGHINGVRLAGEEVDQDDSAIVEETRDTHRGGREEESCV